MVNANPSPSDQQPDSLSSLPKSVGNDVFISYSRRDKTFVEILHTAFKQAQRDPWIDWDDIHKGEEWWKAIQQGIESADTFVFVVSPDSVASSVCRDEIEYAVSCHKRFLPIVWREGFDSTLLHPAIASHNWIFFRETDDFDRAFQDLLTALDTDLNHVRTHTRLLVRAIEWQSKARNASYLLRGSDLWEAEDWLMHSTGKEPQPTTSQSEYISASRSAEAASLKARQRAKWIVVLTTLLANMAFVIAGSIWLQGAATAWAKDWVLRELNTALNVTTLTIDGDEFEELVESQNRSGGDANLLYQRHEVALEKVNTAIPNAFPRTYVVSNQANQIIWVGDVFRMLPASTAATTQLGETYAVAPSQDWLLDGLNEKILVTDIYSDELGSWISACGPIKNSRGQVVGGLRVDFKATYVRDVQREVSQALWVVYIISFIWLAILSLIILRVTRPSGELSTPSPQRKKLHSVRTTH
jgi:hypothetical protein